MSPDFTRILKCKIKVENDYRDKTGLVKPFYKKDSNPARDLVCSHPSAICWDSRWEYKDIKEQWAIYVAVVEICTDECGRFLSRDVLSKNKKAGTEYWVAISSWKRRRTSFNGNEVPDNIGTTGEWEMIQ